TRERAHLATERLRAARRRFEPERRADSGGRRADVEVAPSADEALHVFEQAQLFGRIARHVAVAADAPAAARAAIAEERKDAVAEVGFRRRTKPRHRAARGERGQLARLHVCGMHQAPAAIDRAVLE